MNEDLLAAQLLEDVVQALDAAGERAQRRSLDRGTIRHRIGERHPQLDHIGAALDEIDRVASFFGGTGPLFTFFIEPDAKRPDVYVAQLQQGGTGLLDLLVQCYP